MTTPFTTEMPQRLEPVTHDPFIDDLTVPVVPAVRAGRSANQVQEASHA